MERCSAHLFVYLFSSSNCFSRLTNSRSLFRSDRISRYALHVGADFVRLACACRVDAYTRSGFSSHSEHRNSSGVFGTTAFCTSSSRPKSLTFQVTNTHGDDEMAAAATWRSLSFLLPMDDEGSKPRTSASGKCFLMRGIV